MILIQLFLSYIKIGFFSFGGGYAMLSLLQSELVMRHEWLSSSELADIIAISQMTPGAIAINSATYVGFTVAGIWGSVVATVAVCTPALTLMILITHFFLRLKDNIYIKSFIRCVYPVVIGMIGSAILSLISPRIGSNDNFIDIWSWVIFIITFVLSWRKVSLVVLILSSAVAGVAIYYVAPMLITSLQ